MFGLFIVHENLVREKNVNYKGKWRFRKGRFRAQGLRLKA